jgi:hypothetical protein
VEKKVITKLRGTQLRYYCKRIAHALVNTLLWLAASTVIWFLLILIWVINERQSEDSPEAYSSAHFTIVNKGTHAGILKSDLKSVADDLEDSRPRIMSDLGIREMPHVVVYVYPNGDQEFEDLYGSPTDKIGGFVGIGTTDFIVMQWRESLEGGLSPWEAVGAQVVAGRTAQHEFAHLATNELLFEYWQQEGNVATRAEWNRQCLRGRYCRVTNWYKEVLAQYEARALLSKNLVRTFEERIDTIDPTQLYGDDVYAYGRLVGEYMVSRWGVEGLRDMVLEGGDVQAALGVSSEDFAAGFRTYAKTQMGPILFQYKHTGTVIFD